jgi:Fe-S-cluster-containing dehydrogenase component
MSISRRDLLKGAVVAGAATAVAGAAEAREAVEPSPDAVGMLYDSTLCIGCRACVTRCKEVNGLPHDRGDGEYQQPVDLNGSTKNIIKEFKDGEKRALMKQQCMHCVDPSCVSVCMMGALHKEGYAKRHLEGERKGSGIVLWDKYACTGCRYCQIACPFNVPKFEWASAFPSIVKCELCRHRRDERRSDVYGLANPGCCEVCPRQAVVYGERAALLSEARRRIAAEPERYQAHVYGEKEGGGTQVLYLAPAGVTFANLGLPDLPDGSSAQFSESVSHAPYLHGVTPIALYAAMAGAIWWNHRKDADRHGKEDE